MGLNSYAVAPGGLMLRQGVCSQVAGSTGTSVFSEKVTKERDSCSHWMSQQRLVAESMSYPGTQGELAGTGNLGPARLLTPVRT